MKLEFLTQMVETDISKGMEEIPEISSEFKHYEPFPINDGEYWVSIQASVFHHCWPRETFDDLTMYDSMEMALMGSQGGFLSITEVLPHFTLLENYFSEPIYSFAPVELIEKFYQALKYHLSPTELAQLTQVIDAFEEGREQPPGRFEILEKLNKEHDE